MAQGLYAQKPEIPGEQNWKNCICTQPPRALRIDQGVKSKLKTNTDEKNEKMLSIDQFEILRELGRGGTSIVYLVESKQSARQYAMKVLKPELAGAQRGAVSGEQGRESGNSEGFRINAGNQEELGAIAEELLRAEAQTLAELNNEQDEASGKTPDNKPVSLQTGIPAYYGEVSRDGNFAGFLMEYVEGESLQKLLIDGRVFTVREAAEMGAGLCRVLARMHEMEPPRIYRDLKPGNVLVREDGTCVLVDFGAVRAFRRGAAGDTHPLGTEGYAAPEQYGGWEQSGPRTDVYGIGAVLHHMLTGLPPLETGLRPLAEVMEGGSRAEDLVGSAACVPARGTEVPARGIAGAGLGGAAQQLTARGRWSASGPKKEARQLAEMDKILARCCSIAPSMRFSSCRELENALGRLCGEEAKMPWGLRWRSGIGTRFRRGSELGFGKTLGAARSLLFGKSSDKEIEWKRFISFLYVTLALILCTGLFGAVASGAERSRYRSLIREAEAAGSPEEQLALFRQAVKIRPGDAEAYVALLKQLSSDGDFTQEEKDVMDSFLYENGFLSKTRERKSSAYAALEMELGKVCFGFFEGGMEAARRCFENVADTAGAGVADRRFARAMCVVTGNEWTAERADAWLFVVREAAGGALESGDGAFAAAVCSRAAGEVALFPDRFEAAGAGPGVLREVQESVAGFARAVGAGWPLVPPKLAAELRTAVEAMERVGE